MKQRQSAPAPQRAPRRSYRFHFLSIERLGPQTSRYVLWEDGDDGRPRVITALRTPRAFAWEAERSDPQAAAATRPPACNDEKFELWLGFLDTVYQRTGTTG